MSGSSPADGVFAEALAVVERWRARAATQQIAPFSAAPVAAGPVGLIEPTTRGLSSVQLVERALAAIDQRSDELGAFVAVFAEQARAEARACDDERAAGDSRGPLHGMPISVKDLYAVEGSLTRAGSDAFSRRDASDCAAVARLRATGAVILGKTVTHEFAMGVISPTSRNPHDPARIAGGSSSGAAVAVASGMGVAALGTDTRGSIRIPAALCGVVGFKPTLGAVSLVGVVPLSWSMDHGGVIAATVDDAEAVYGCLVDAPPAPPAPLTSVEGLRVGLPRAAWQDAEQVVCDQVDVALARLAGDGALVTDIERPSANDLEEANLASIVVSRCEALAFHRELGLDPARCSDDIRLQLAAAEAATARDYIDAQRLRAELRDQLLGVFDRVDVLAMPTVPLLAPRADAVDGLSLLLTRNVAIWSFAGFPAISVPCLPGGQALPAGLQLVAPPGRERALFALARTVAQGSR